MTEASTTASAAPLRITARIADPEPSSSAVSDEPTCVVCLQPCPGMKACACSFMHQQCAESYKQVYGSCKVCSVEFSTENLRKRKVEHDEAELEARAQKRRCAREAAERTANLDWARRVAPSAAHILFRHFRHANAEPQADLGFETIVLSLIHSGEQYIEDLGERLGESMARPEVDAAIKRLQVIGDALVSAHDEGVDEPCANEFLRLFRQALAQRSSPPFRLYE